MSTPEGRDDDVAIYEVRDYHTRTMFVGATTWGSLGHRGRQIRRGVSYAYKRSALDLWVLKEKAEGRSVYVACVSRHSLASLGLPEGGDRKKHRKIVDGLINSRVSILPKEVVARLLNRRLPGGEESALLAGGSLEGERRVGTGAGARRHVGDARNGEGVVYGLYHNCKLIYVGTTAKGKRDTMQSLMQCRYNPHTKSKVMRYVHSLHEEGRLHELVFKRLGVYPVGGRGDALEHVIFGLGEDERKGLLNQRAGALTAGRWVNK